MLEQFSVTVFIIVVIIINSVITTIILWLAQYAVRNALQKSLILEKTEKFLKVPSSPPQLVHGRGPGIVYQFIWFSAQNTEYVDPSPREGHPVIRGGALAAGSLDSL